MMTPGHDDRQFTARQKVAIITGLTLLCWGIVAALGVIAVKWWTP